MAQCYIQVGMRSVLNGKAGKMLVKQLYTKHDVELNEDGHAIFNKEELFGEKDGWNFQPVGGETLGGMCLVIGIHDPKDYPTDLPALRKLVEKSSELFRLDKERLVSLIDTMIDNGERHILSGNRGLWMTKNHNLIQDKAA